MSNAEFVAAGPARAAALPEILDPLAFPALAAEIELEGAIETFGVFVRDSQSRLAVLDDLHADAGRRRIEVEAHSLGAAAATFGLMRMAELARRLEDHAATVSDGAYRADVARLHAAFAEGRSLLCDTFGIAV